MNTLNTEIVVLGGGPGGYAAAFYAADHGKQVILVDQEKFLGGVCLRSGCIPSKALLHTAKVLNEAKAAVKQGIDFGKPAVDLDKLRAWKNSVVERLSSGLDSIAEKRKVKIIEGRGHFEDSGTLRVETREGQMYVRYEHAIVAVGSQPSVPKAFDLGNPRIMTSTEALQIPDVPKSLLVIGGGYIGLEMGTVYSALGSRVVLAEATPRLLSGVDPDLVRPVQKAAEKIFAEVRLEAKVAKMSTKGNKIEVVFMMGTEGKNELYDRVLVSVGRFPNVADLGLENTKVEQDERGYVRVDEKRRTADPRIFAIGDVAGGIQLAHKAAKEARVAVETIAGEESVFDNITIPAVVFTDPEVAWCGLTETEAKERGIDVKVARFPWSASGRALTLDRPEGLTKLLIEAGTERVLGVGIAGPSAGDLISEGVLAVEMGATAKDLAESVHPHPTLSETIGDCAEAYYGTSPNIAPSRLPV